MSAAQTRRTPKKGNALMKNFKSEDLKQENMPGLTLVDFWAPWCGPCRMAAPILESLSEEYEGKVTFGKINIDEEPDCAVEKGVMSIPTLILFKDGKEADRIIGMQGKNAFKALVEKHLV